MKLNLKDYLKKFEGGYTIKAFAAVGGPDFSDKHLCSVLRSAKERFERDLHDGVRRLTRDCENEDILFDCSEEISDSIIDGNYDRDLQVYIERALKDFGYDDAADIEDLPEDTISGIVYQVTEEYMRDQVAVHVEEFFTAYLIKYVLLPNGIDTLDSELFTKYFNSSDYGYDSYNPNHIEIIDGFKRFLNDNGINI